MGYGPKSSSELNQFHIERTLKKLQRNEIRVQDCNLNKRFDRLKRDSEAWYDELYPKYVAIVREKSMLTQ